MHFNSKSLQIADLYHLFKYCKTYMHATADHVTYPITTKGEKTCHRLCHGCFLGSVSCPGKDQVCNVAPMPCLMIEAILN